MKSDIFSNEKFQGHKFIRTCIKTVYYSKIESASRSDIAILFVII